MKQILIRASKSPFTNFFNGPVPYPQLVRVHRMLNEPGIKNIGNLVFAHSAYKALDTAGQDLTIDDYKLSLRDSFTDEADEINERYDAFVIPLCNSFRLSYKDTLERMTRTIRRLKIPCVVNGVGAQGTLGGNFERIEPIADAARDFVAAVLDRSQTIGVRGELTLDYLVKLGFPSSRFDLIGCPSMFYNGQHMEIRKPAGPLRSIALNLSEAKRKNINHITRYFNSHTEGVTYVPQIRALMPSIGNGNLPPPDTPDTMESPVPNLRREGKVQFYVDVVPWMDFMRTQSFAIGTRIHGNVVALLAGTPAHVIAHDSRTLELARYFEIPYTPLNKVTEAFNPQDIYDQSDYGALTRGHAKRLQVYAAFLERNGLEHALYDDARLAMHDQRVRASLQHPTLQVEPELEPATD